MHGGKVRLSENPRKCDRLGFSGRATDRVEGGIDWVPGLKEGGIVEPRSLATSKDANNARRASTIDSLVLYACLNLIYYA